MKGTTPYPCRHTITSKKIAAGPQYSIQIQDWKTGTEVASADFAFGNPTNATKRDFNDIPDTDELSGIFKRGVIEMTVWKGSLVILP